MGQMRVCPQCREGFQLAATGRRPTYCSATCRKAAWEARKLQAAVDEAVAAERERANRGNETANRGNETTADAQLQLGVEECPYCRDVVTGLLAHLVVCPEGPGFIS